MVKCIHCDNEADYDSPADLCEEHWIRWWTGGDPNDSLGLTPEEAEDYYQEVKGWMKKHKKKS